MGLLGILRTQAGRIRAGWRIFFFFLLLPLFVLPVSLLPLEGLNWQTFPFLLAGLLGGWVLLAMDGRGPGALGFYLAPGAAVEAFMGLCLGVVVGLAVTLGIFLLGGVRWESEAGTAWGYLHTGLRALWFFTLPAAAEEVLFRGYLLQALAEVWGGLHALWATSLAFGVLHLTNPNASPVGIGNIVVAGLFLGAVYLKTASLWWATGAHLGWNWALGFLADTPVSGLELVNAPLYDPVAQGAPWISGGAFGAEGSLVATVMLAVAAYLVWQNPALKPGNRAIDVRPLFLSSPECSSGDGKQGVPGKE